MRILRHAAALAGLTALAILTNVSIAESATSSKSSRGKSSSQGWRAKGGKQRQAVETDADDSEFTESNDEPPRLSSREAREARPISDMAPAWEAPTEIVRRRPVRKVSHEAIFDDEPAAEEEIGTPEEGEIVIEESGEEVEIEGLHGLRRHRLSGRHDHADCGGCGHCDECLGCIECEEYGYEDMFCFPRVFLDESSVFVGPQSFKGPIDQGRNGNFGFHEGFNLAGQFLRMKGIGYQAGAQFVQSNFLGDTVSGDLGSNRRQSFVTAGLFHRAFRNRGLQFGAVWDYVDDVYYVRSRGAQVRGEISVLGPYCHELGFWGAFGVRNDSVTDRNGIQDLKVTDLYAAFYRYNLSNGGQGRVWGGASGAGDGLFGADFRVPLSNRWDLNGGFNYLIPKQGSNSNGLAQEGWGLTMNLVWYPFRRHEGVHNTPYRPLFNVADNNVFMFDRVSP